LTPNGPDIAGFLVIAKNADVRTGPWRAFESRKLDARETLQNEIGGSIGIHHAGANDSEPADWRNGRVIVGVRYGKHPISCESRLRHVPVAFLKDIQRQESAWKKRDPREDHDIRLVW
jgi:hypothetical protein